MTEKALADCSQIGGAVVCDANPAPDIDGFTDTGGNPITSIEIKANVSGVIDAVAVFNNAGNIINSITIDPGNQVSAGAGGTAIATSNQLFSNFVNNGTIIGSGGGLSIRDFGGFIALPTMTAVNNGTIRTADFNAVTITGGNIGAINFTNNNGAIIDANGTDNNGYSGDTSFTTMDNVTNSGEIIGGDDGVFTGAGNDSVFNTNTIRVGTIAEDGLNDNAIDTSTGNDTVTNSGILRSLNQVNGGRTVELGDGDDIFEVRNGSQIFSDAGMSVGGVNGGNNTDTLRFGGTETQAFDLARIGMNTNQFHNFETFQVFQGQTNFTGATNEAFSVENGATLGGTGTFGGLTNNTGGTIAPGNSIGTTVVNGNLVLNAGSTLLIEVSQTGADQVDVDGGTVTINNATLQVDDLAPALEDASQTFVIIDNDGNDAVVGSFGTIVDNLAFLNPLISLTGGDGNDVVLSFEATGIDLTRVANTSNQRGAGAAFNSTPSDNEDVQTINNAFLPLTNEQASNGLNTMTGEVYGASQQGMNTSGLFLGNNVLGLAGNQIGQSRNNNGNGGSQAFSTLGYLPTASARYGADLAIDDATIDEQVTGKNFFFANGLYRHATIDADGNGGKTTITNGGVVAGGGYDFDGRFAAGIAGGYLRTDVDVSSVGSEVDGDSPHVSVFASFQDGGFDVIGSVGYMYSDLDSSRNVIIGSLSRTATADYTSHSTFGSAELGYTFDVSNLAIRPFVGGGFAVTHQEGFTETGAGAANLVVQSTTDTLGQVIAGIGASTEFVMNGTTIRPHAEIAWDRLLGDVTPSTTASFAPGSISFTSTGATPEEDRLSVTAGAVIDFTTNLSGFAEYQGIFSSNDREHTGRAGIKFTF